MRQETLDHLATSIEGIRRLKAAKPEVTWWIGVNTRMGGYGDFLVDCALARAARRHWRRALGGRHVVGVMALGHEAGQPQGSDLMASQSDLDAAFLGPPLHWRPKATGLRAEFDLFLDVRLAVRSTFRDPARFAAEQLAADATFGDYRELYDHYPHACHAAQLYGLSQLELMAHTAGVPLTADDLRLDTTVRRVEGAEPCGIDLAQYAGCVTVHNAQGEGLGTKRLPDAAFERIVRELVAMGLRPVQVGRRDKPKIEPPIQGAVDLRGLRLPETAQVIAAAVAHVDCEGFLVHVARAVRTRSIVFFGPTSPALYGYPCNVNVTRAICPPPFGPHCNWMRSRWSRRCLLGCHAPDGAPLCINHPQPEEAARIIRDALTARPPEIATGASHNV